MDDVNSNLTIALFDVPGDVHLILLHALYGIAFIAGTIGNSLVILAVLLSKKLRTTTNAFVVNLSIADLLTCLVLPVYSIYVRAFLFRIGDRLIGFGVGIVTRVILNTTLGCSVLTLMSIAINRWLLITRPLTTYRKIYTPKKIAFWLVFVWVILLLFIVTSTFVLVRNWRIFLAVTAVVMLTIPLIVIILCYVLIWERINRQARRMASSTVVSHEPMTADIPTDDIPGPNNSVQSPASSSAVRVMTTGSSQLCRCQTEITKNMFYVVCAFVMCIGPYAICFCLGVNLKLVSDYAYTIVLFNSCINPLIYATKHRDFKTVFRCIVRRQWDNIPEPSDFLKARRRSKFCGRSNPV